MSNAPFNKSLQEIGVADLINLTQTHEGWFIEYKSEFTKPAELAKSISSFANQHGGWLFFGVREDPTNMTAGEFPGLSDEAVSSGLQSLRNASKDLLTPSVYYDHRTFPGPIPELELPSGRQIVVVHVPQGSDTPYAHNNGRIYQRIGDASQPSHIHDRTAFDLLAQRRIDAQRGLEDIVSRRFETSQGEQSSCYFHLLVLSDPYRTYSHRYHGTFDHFSTTMSQGELPFDNMFSGNNELIARQLGGGTAYDRRMSWHFSLRCDSHVTMPVTILNGTTLRDWEPYTIGEEFHRILTESDSWHSRVLDLNGIPAFCMAVVRRHQELLRESNVQGPLYIKARVENVWRSIPFIDWPAYLEHAKKWHLPVYQDSDLVIPPGTSLDSFVLGEMPENLPLEPGPDVYGGGIDLAVAVLSALGIPAKTVKESARDLVGINDRRAVFERRLVEKSRRT